MNRNSIIRLLVDFSLEAAAKNPGDSWLREILTKGFRGFENLSSKNLLRELQFRGLAEFEDAPQISDDEAGGGDFEDRAEYRIENLIRSHRQPV